MMPPELDVVEHIQYAIQTEAGISSMPSGVVDRKVAEMIATSHQAVLLERTVWTARTDWRTS